MALEVADTIISDSIDHTFTALSANESTNHISVELPNHQYAREFTVTTAVTGGPSDADITLDGSLDGTTFFDLSGTITAHAAASMTHIVNKPVKFVRATLASLTGGTSPTITVRVVAKGS